MQEVDRFEQVWLPALRALGYEGFFKRRTGGKPDGVATFVRTSKYAGLCIRVSLPVSLSDPFGL